MWHILVDEFAFRHALMEERSFGRRVTANHPDW
jgi:hypothetical protein